MTTPQDDLQRAAFTDAAATDWTSQATLLADAAFYPPGAPDADPIRPPEDWDAEGWDETAEGPKSLDEARDALTARIADPHAPDTAAVTGAYDQLED